MAIAASPTIHTVYPVVSGPRILFTVVLGATPGERTHLTPTAWLGMTGPADCRICRAGNRRSPPRDLPAGKQGVDPCVPQASVRVWPAMTIHSASQLVFIYRVTLELLRLRA